MRLIIIYGVTASGKTQLSLDLSDLLGGAPIINADSLQVYKGLDIGVDKVSSEIRSRYEHYLIDCVEPPDLYTAGRFYRDLVCILKELENKCSYAIITGGSAFYLKMLKTGLLPVNEADEEVEKKYLDLLEVKGVKALYQDLELIDPDLAKKLHPNDKYRIYRALVIYHSSGKSRLSYEKEYQIQPLNYPMTKVALFVDREILRKRVSDRIDLMFKKGLLEETQSLLDRGLRDWRPLSSIGYREAQAVLENSLSSDEAKEKIFYRTMGLAKRQDTWFRKEDDLFWFQFDKIDYLKRFIKKEFSL